MKLAGIEPPRDPATPLCGHVSIYSTLSERFTCGREQGHTGAHIAFLPNVSIGWPQT